jgi:hypothetical protein
MSKIYKVIKVINSTEIVINAGKEKIEEFDKFLVYSLDEELFDPDTKESLGQLETVKGTVGPLHIQEKLTTLQSNEFEIVKGEVKEIIRSNTNSKSTSLGLALMGFNDRNKTSEIITPVKKEKKKLNNVKIGDFVKQI